MVNCVQAELPVSSFNRFRRYNSPCSRIPKIWTFDIETYPKKRVCRLYQRCKVCHMFEDSIQRSKDNPRFRLNSRSHWVMSGQILFHLRISSVYRMDIPFTSTEHYLHLFPVRPCEVIFESDWTYCQVMLKRLYLPLLQHMIYREIYVWLQ
jgi:hypothetical protein